jgi:hypothetical protein
MFIYMNERTLNRPRKLKRKLQFADIEIDETNLCEMKDLLLQEENSLVSPLMTSSKRSTSQTLDGDSTRAWVSSEST